MPDSLSILLGSLLSKVTVFGTVIVGMKFALTGQFLLTAAFLAPLLLVLYLMAADGPVLR